MNPGQGIACRHCRNFHPETWELGYPNPCAMVQWVDNKHRGPALSDDGRRCEEYDGPALDPQDPDPAADSLGEAIEACAGDIELLDICEQ